MEQEQPEPVSSPETTSGPETMEVEGKTLEIVPKQRPRENLSRRQVEIKLELYKRLASMLPVEGRDYLFEISFQGGSLSPSVRFVPKTPLGTIWCNYIAGEFRKMTK